MLNILGSEVGSHLDLFPLIWVFIGAEFLEPSVIRSVHTREKLNIQPSPLCLSVSHQNCHISEADDIKDHSHQHLECRIYRCHKASVFKEALLGSYVEENKGCRKLLQNILCLPVAGLRILSVASVAASWEIHVLLLCGLHWFLSVAGSSLLHAHKPASRAQFCVPAVSLKLTALYYVYLLLATSVLLQCMEALKC